MAIFVRTVRALFKRPFIIVFWSLVMLVYYLVDYNVSRVLLHFTERGEENILESIIHFLQFILNFLTDSKAVPSIILYFLAFIFVASIPVGLILSGYLYIVDNTVAGKQKVKGEFFQGIRKHFIRVWFITFRVMIYSSLFVIFILVASVPAIIITKSVAAGKIEMAALAVFIDVVSVCVLFFGSVFFRTYMFFWYPAALICGKKAFKKGKVLVDAYFWRLAARFLVLDVIYVLFLSTAITINNLFILFLVSWVFASIYFSFLITYIFTAFRVFRARTKTR